jgi:hypothetical protein
VPFLGRTGPWPRGLRPRCMGCRLTCRRRHPHVGERSSGAARSARGGRRPADALPPAEGWELVLAENIGYLVDDQRRRAALRDCVASSDRRPSRSSPPRMRCCSASSSARGRPIGCSACAEVAISGAPWSAYPGIGLPGADRIDLFSGARPVLALDSNGLRVLTRLGHGDRARSYAASYRDAQASASKTLPETVPALKRAYQLLRRHGQTTCRRTASACISCPIARDCPSAGTATPLY